MTAMTGQTILDCPSLGSQNDVHEISK